MGCPNYAAVCAIVKDEHLALPEFVAYHHAIGFEKFIFYDNESAIPVRETLKEYVARGIVDVFRVVGSSMQMPCYTRCLQDYRDKVRWIAFIDADEFLILKRHADVRLLLFEYEAHAGLAVHWVTHGSGGHLGRPGGLVLDAYTEQFTDNTPDNLHVKSIVQPARTERARDPHQFFFTPGHGCVDEHGTPVTSALAPFTADIVQLNHYVFKSQQDYEAKMRRGRADNHELSDARRLEGFWNQTRRPTATLRPLSHQRSLRLRQAVNTGQPYRDNPHLDVDTACADESQLSATVQGHLAHGRPHAALLHAVLYRNTHGYCWIAGWLTMLAWLALRRKDMALAEADNLLRHEPSVRSHYQRFYVLDKLGEREKALHAGRYIRFACEILQRTASPEYAELRRIDAKKGLGIW